MPDQKHTNLKKSDPVRNAELFQNQSKSAHSDVLGSYTGTPVDGDMPEQDADDL